MVRCYPNSKIRVTETCFPYETKSLACSPLYILFICFSFPLITKLLKFIRSSVFSNQNEEVFTCFIHVVVRLSLRT